MISHEFTQIAEGFRTSDESDLIGSKLLHSPRSKGEYIPLKYSNSIENSRYFANYAEKFERQNPQSMKVITFQSEPKAKESQASKLMVAKHDPNESAQNSRKVNGKSEQGGERKGGKEVQEQRNSTFEVSKDVKESNQQSSKKGTENIEKDFEEKSTVEKAQDNDEIKREEKQEKVEEKEEKKGAIEGNNIEGNAKQDHGDSTKSQESVKETDCTDNNNDNDGEDAAERKTETSQDMKDEAVQILSREESKLDELQKVEKLKAGHSPSIVTNPQENSIQESMEVNNTEVDLESKVKRGVRVEVQEESNDKTVLEKDTKGTEEPKKQVHEPRPIQPSLTVEHKPHEASPKDSHLLSPLPTTPQPLPSSTNQDSQSPSSSTNPTPQPLPSHTTQAPPVDPSSESKSKNVQKEVSTITQGEPSPRDSNTPPVLLGQPSDGFNFSKDLTFKTKVTLPGQGPSALGISLLERAHKTKGFQGSRLQIPDYHVPCLQLVVFILIHSSYLPNKLSNLRVPPNATVEYVIDISVKKLNDLIDKHRPEDPPLVPGKCQLLLAEEDGRPDTDTPVLQRDAAVHRFGCIYFALCKDPEADGGGFSADTKTFKVVLPTKEYQVLSYKRSLSLGQVLEKVCNKRQLDPLVHFLVHTPSNGNKEVEVNLDTLVSDLDTPEVTIKCRMQSRKITSTLKNPLRPASRSKSRHELFSSSDGTQDSLAPPVLNSKVSRHLGVPKEYFWSPASVSSYVQYNVIKINKYGKKQERVMGIDRERITNSMPLNKPTIKTNRPTRMMADVIRAFIADRPLPSSPSPRKPFSIEFTDTIQEYESDKADEIVARINYILSLENAIPKPKQRADE